MYTPHLFCPSNQSLSFHLVLSCSILPRFSGVRSGRGIFSEVDDGRGLGCGVGGLGRGETWEKGTTVTSKCVDQSMPTLITVPTCMYTCDTRGCLILGLCLIPHDYIFFFEVAIGPVVSQLRLQLQLGLWLGLG